MSDASEREKVATLGEPVTDVAYPKPETTVRDGPSVSTPDAGARAVAPNAETFTAWLCEQMPAGTVIGNPEWWAPKILRAVQAFTAATPPRAASQRHDFIKTGDPDVYPQITDENGEVVLSHCRRCGQAEGDLAETCPAAASPDDVVTLAHAARLLNVALAKRILAERNTALRAAGTPDEWPAQQSWTDLVHSSHCIFQQAARREAGVDDSPRFSELLARYLPDDDGDSMRDLAASPEPEVRPAHCTADRRCLSNHPCAMPQCDYGIAEVERIAAALQRRPTEAEPEAVAIPELSAPDAPSYFDHNESVAWVSGFDAGVARALAAAPRADATCPKCAERDASAAFWSERYDALHRAFSRNGLTCDGAVVDQLVAKLRDKPHADATAGWVDINTPMPEHFREYVERNYPPGVVIGNPAWHAPKLWGAALYALRAAQPETSGGAE